MEQQLPPARTRSYHTQIALIHWFFLERSMSEGGAPPRPLRTAVKRAAEPSEPGTVQHSTPTIHSIVVTLDPLLKRGRLALEDASTGKRPWGFSYV